MRERQEKIIAQIERIKPEMANRMRACGQYVMAIECLGCETKHFAGFMRCKVRYCLPCAKVRAMLWVSRILKFIEDNQDEYEYHMVNLTIRSMDDLAIMYDTMQGYWRKLVHVHGKSNVHSKVFRARFLGGIKSVEVKKGKKGWHVHIHSLVCTVKGEYKKDYEWLQRAWYDITNGNGSVYVKKIKGSIKDVVEVTKYIVKPGIYSDEEMLEIITYLVGRQQVSTFGVMRGMGRAVEADMESVEDKKLAQFICAKCGCTEGQLKKIEAEIAKQLILYDPVR